MGEAKHGPWRRSYGAFVRTDDEDRTAVACVYGENGAPEHNDETAIARADLIAAAPDLLEAAKEAIQELGRIGHQDNPEFPEFRKLCAAVDKAEGDQ